MSQAYLVLVGLVAGVCSGLFGIGGGVIIVPALMYGLAYSQKLATGTSLAILLPPIGIAAVMQYHRSGNVNFVAALFIGLSMVVGSWLGARFAIQMDAKMLKSLFGLFLLSLGAFVLYDARVH